MKNLKNYLLSIIFNYSDFFKELSVENFNLCDKYKNPEKLLCRDNLEIVVFLKSSIEINVLTIL